MLYPFNIPEEVMLTHRSSRLEENLKDAEKGPLPQEVLDALDKAWKVSMVDTPNYWHLDLKYTYDTRKALFGK